MNNKCFPFCFETYRTKVNYRLNTDLEKEKEDMFEKLLETSYNSEIIYKILNKDTIILKTKSIILDHKLKQDYDEKYLFTPLRCNTKVGDIFYWERTNTHWIVYAQYLTEKSYFKNIIKRADWCINWKDENDNIKFQWVYVRGPVETNFKELSLKKNIMIKPNESLVILMPNNDDTKKFKKYDTIMLNGKKWKISAIPDDISNTELIEIQLIKTEVNYNDDVKNNIVNGLEENNYEFKSFIPEKIKINSLIDINKNIFLYKNGSIIKSDFTIVPLTNNLTIKNNNIIFPSNEEKCEFKIIYNLNKNIQQVFSIQTTNEDINLNNKIIGETLVKTLFEYNYYTEIFNENDKFIWEIEDQKNIVKEFFTDKNKIKIKYGTKTGNILLKLIINEILIDSINIKVIGTYE